MPNCKPRALGRCTGRAHVSEIAADKTQARPMAPSGGQDAAGGLARTPASALLGAEFLALENKSNLQAHRGLRSGPREPLGRSGRLRSHRSEGQSLPLQPGRLCPCPTAPEVLSR